MQNEGQSNRFVVIKWFMILAVITAAFSIFSELVLKYSYYIPLNVRFRPSANPYYTALCVLTFLLVFILWKRDYFISLSERKFLLLSFFITFFFHLSLASTDKGFMYAIPHSFISTPYEYYWDTWKIDGLSNFLKDYVKLMSSTLSLHASTHPPGPDIFLYLIHKFIGNSLMLKSLIAVIVSNLSIIPLFLTLKLFLQRRALRFAIILWIFTPAIAIYSAVCMDGVFMFFMLWPFYFFLRYVVTGKNLVPLSVLTGISLSIASFMTFSVAYQGLFFTLLAGYCIYKKHGDWKSHVLNLVIIGALFVVFYFFFYQVTGYNVLDCLDSARDKDLVNYGSPFYSLKKYSHSRIYNFLCYIIFMGFAASGVFCFYLTPKYRRLGLGNKLARGITYVAVLTMLEMNIGGLYFFETGRIWVYLSPIFLVPVAETVTLLSDASKSRIFESQVLILTFLQALIIEIIFYTFW